MTDIITSTKVNGEIELEHSHIRGPFIEYKFKTDFRKAANLTGSSKRITVRVRRVGPITPNPIEVEVVIIKPGLTDELVLTQPDINLFTIINPNIGGQPTLPVTEAIAPDKEELPGIVAMVNNGTGPVRAFGDGLEIVLGEENGTPGGHSPPVRDDRWKYEIKDNDPDGVWLIRIKNKGVNTEVFAVDITHPDMQFTLTESVVPFSLVNRFLDKVNTLVGLKVHLDRDATISFRDEFKHITDLDNIVIPIGKIGEIRGTGNDIFLQDITMILPVPQISPSGTDTISLLFPIGIETTGPTEIEINSSPNIDITKFLIDLDFKFKGAGFTYIEKRNLAGDLISTHAPSGLIKVRVKPEINVATISDIEDIIREKFFAKVFSFFHSERMRKALAIVADHFTDALIFLAAGDDDRIFYDLKVTPTGITVRHYPRPTARLRNKLTAESAGDVHAPMATMVGAGVTPSVPPNNGGTRRRSALSRLFSRIFRKPKLVGNTGTVAGTDNPRPSVKKKIEHIVVLMLENRSFDHMLGYLTNDNGRADIDGLGAAPNHTNTVPGSTQTHSVFVLNDGKQIAIDPGHSVSAVEEQIAGGAMSGFIANYTKRSGVEPGQEKLVMGFYNAEKVAVFNQLANEYLVCDRWFCSHPGATYPNRFISVMGSTPDIKNLDLTSKAGGSVKGDTIFDVLTEAKVGWKYVESNIAFLRMFDKYRVDEKNIIQRDEWLKQASEGNLPAVSWVDPHIGNLEVDDNADDDHPPANVVRGQEGVQEIYKALTKNKAQWAKTLFIITYDEHGGFYDHVPPHGLNGETNPVVHKIHEDGAMHYGPRVPSILVSPWVKKQSASSTVFDHTSILKTILVNFIGPEAANKKRLGERVDAANSLLDLLEDKVRSDVPVVTKPNSAPNPVAGDVDIAPERSSYHLAMRLFGLGPKFRKIVAERIIDL